MKKTLFASLFAVLCSAALTASADTPASANPLSVVPELANASFPELRDALNDVSDKSIEAARHARDLSSSLDAAIVDSTVSTPEIDELRARRDELLKELSAAEAALRSAILKSDEFKARAAEVEKARAKAEELANRRTAIRALLAQRRREAALTAPQPAQKP